jgi:hypothetical protein
MDIEPPAHPNQLPTPQPSCDSFVQESTTDKASLQRMLESAPEEFCRAAVNLLAGAEPSTGYRYLVHLLLKHKLLERDASAATLSAGNGPCRSFDGAAI